MATIDFSQTHAIRGESALTVTLENGDTAVLDTYVPASFSGSVTVLGGNIQVMKSAESPSGQILQVFRIDEVVAP